MEGEIDKFKESEIIVGVMLTLGVDAICILIDLTGVGLFIAPILQSSITFAMWMWFKSKGGQKSGLGKQIAKYAANALPIIPTTFIAFVIETFIHNHPKVAQVAGQTAGTVVGTAVAGPAGARIGAAVGQYAMGGSATESATSAIPSKIPLKK